MNNPINKEEMKAFLKEHPFTPEILEKYLKRFELENINLEEEKKKIDLKTSYLSASKRRAVLELVSIKNIMNEIEKDKLNEKELTETANFNTIS